MSKIVKRHLTPYIFSLTGVAIFIMPLLYISVFVLSDTLGKNLTLWITIALSFFSIILYSKISIDFLLDKLIISNYRIVHSNWRHIFRREEEEIDLKEIQDVKTTEKGILAKLPIFNFGTLTIETAASKPSIIFKDCPHPRIIKHFILSRIGK